MEIGAQEVIKGYKLALKFIEGLDEKQFSKWLEGEFTLGLQEVHKSKKVVKEVDKQLVVYEEALKQCQTYEEAKSYLQGLKLNKPKLVELAKSLSACMKSRDNKDQIIEKIIQATVGNRLKMEVLGSKVGS